MVTKPIITDQRSFLGKSLRTEAGAGFRFDDVDNIALSHTAKRMFLNDFKRGDVDELNAFAYLNETIDLTKDLSVTPACDLTTLHSDTTTSLTDSSIRATKQL